MQDAREKDARYEDGEEKGAFWGVPMSFKGEGSGVGKRCEDG
jgi:Asp-tRNA(Asn)/Glu-tRNA(Gln) amidotransferase A subunit family amidase